MTNIEKHVQTVTSAVAIALLLWVGNSVNELIRNQARTDERVTNAIAEFDRRISSLEAKVDKLMFERANGNSATKDL